MVMRQHTYDISALCALRSKTMFDEGDYGQFYKVLLNILDL